MIKKIGTILVCILLIASSLVIVLPVEALKASSNTLYVGGNGPGNYTKIQDAIDNASTGDTIFVNNGTYYENIIVDKSVYLIGENKEGTIIDAKKIGTTVTIFADDCLVSNFSLLNCEDYINQDWGVALIKIIKGNKVVVNSNILDAGPIQTTSYNDYGAIDLNGSNYCIITNNFIIQNASYYYTCGIGLHNNSSNNFLAKNSISNFQFGIYIEDIGINQNNNISYNYLHDNEFGISIANNLNEFLNNIVENNTEVGINIQGCDNNIISGNIVRYNGAGEKFHCGIELMGYDNNHDNIVYNNIISYNNPCGLQSEYSNRNIITKNNFIDNNGVGNPEDWWGNAYIHVQDGFFKKDIFKNNYWSDSISILPKVIHGNLDIMRTNFFIKWLNFDWHPAKEPFDIS